MSKMSGMRFNVISIHYTNKCNMNCPFCYIKKRKEKDAKFWYDLIPYLKKLTPQIALGGGEPYTNPDFIKEFSKRCKKAGLIVNTTTNGRLLAEMDDKQLKEVLKNITMVSISWDNYKIKTDRDKTRYLMLVKRIKKHTKCQVGCNLLIDKDMNIIEITNAMFNLVGVDRVFALFPKNMPRVDILKWKGKYYYLSEKYEHFYVDDVSKCILESGKYSGWEFVCHRGKDMISINQDGSVSSCSFAKPFIRLNHPKDILNIRIPKAELGKNFCPFIGDRK